MEFNPTLLAECVRKQTRRLTNLRIKELRQQFETYGDYSKAQIKAAAIESSETTLYALVNALEAYADETEKPKGPIRRATT